MKTATIFLALLVAVLLLLPAPVSAAGLRSPERAQQPSALEQEADAANAAPNEAQEEAADGSSIVDLHATAARLRGRVELSWRVEAGASDGLLVVERSTNGSSWRPVKACGQRYEPAQTDYSCTDMRLTSGTTYAYRVCLVAKGATCSSASPSEPVAVKAP